MKTATGCRPDQLFGVWSIEETRFRRMVALAKAADLEKLRAEATAAAERTAGQPLYMRGADGVAVIEISGPMTKYPTSFQALLGGTSTLQVREALRAAARDPEVLGIMLVVDSPGGTLAGTGDLADDVRRIAARKPLYAYVADLAASAALWAISGARQVFANANAEVGSIGVYQVVEDTSQAYLQAGVKVHVVSSAPPIKGAGVDGTEISPEQLAEWERRITDLADVFVSELATGRRMTKEKAQGLATGQVWVATKAREFGLIDDVVSLDEAMRRLRSEAMNEQDTKDAKAAAEAVQQTMATERAAREQAEQRLAAAEQKLKELEARERAARFAKEAEALGAPAAFAQVLDAIEAAVGAVTYEALTTQLRAASEQASKGQLFGEIGTGGAAGGATGANEFESLAQAAVKAGRAKSLTDAYKLVAKENPKAYQLHVESVRKGAA